MPAYVSKWSAATAGCACFTLTDTCVTFGPDTVKRPDIALWCREPENLHAFITERPDVVIELIRTGYEEKDHDGAALYLEFGVADVLTIDPRIGVIRRYETAEKWSEIQSPSVVELRWRGRTLSIGVSAVVELDDGARYVTLPTSAQAFDFTHREFRVWAPYGDVRFPRHEASVRDFETVIGFVQVRSN